MAELQPSHLGIVVKDAKKVSEGLSSLWGMGPWEVNEYAPRKEDMIVGDPFSCILVYAKMGPMTIELIEPTSENNMWANFLRDSGGGVHHLAFQVDDWEKKVADTKAQGGQMIVGASFEGKNWCYFKLPDSKMIVEYMDGYGI